MGTPVSQSTIVGEPSGAVFIVVSLAAKNTGDQDTRVGRLELRLERRLTEGRRRYRSTSESVHWTTWTDLHSTDTALIEFSRHAEGYGDYV